MKIRDGKWYGIKGKLGAHWFKTLSDAKGDITKDQWDAISFGKICTDSLNFASWSATIQKLCDSCNCCAADPVNDLMAFMSRVQHFSSALPLTTEPAEYKAYWMDGSL